MKMKNVTEPTLKSYGNSKDVTDDEKAKKLLKKPSKSLKNKYQNYDNLSKNFEKGYILAIFLPKVLNFKREMTNQ